MRSILTLLNLALIYCLVSYIPTKYNTHIRKNIPILTRHNERQNLINKEQAIHIITIRHHDYRKTEQAGQTSFPSRNHNTWIITSGTLIASSATTYFIYLKFVLIK